MREARKSVITDAQRNLNIEQNADLEPQCKYVRERTNGNYKTHFLSRLQYPFVSVEKFTDAWGEISQIQKLHMHWVSVE